MSYIVNAAIDAAVKASISTPVELLHLTSEKILSEFINVSITARGQASISYKNGSAIMNY